MLTVILVSIVVGLAATVALSTFGSKAEEANLDAVRSDLQNIAAQMQTYYQKPAQLGGGGTTFTGISFYNFGFAADTINADGTLAENENGIYSIQSISEEEVVVYGFGSLDGELNFSNITTTSLTLQATITEGDAEVGFIGE